MIAGAHRRQRQIRAAKVRSPAAEPQRRKERSRERAAGQVALVRQDRGRRLDHIWVSPALKEAALSNGRGAFAIWDEERGREKPSDHVPVTLTLRL